MEQRWKLSSRTMLLILLIFIALFSILVVSRIVTSPDFNVATIKSLDSKEDTVIK